MGIFDKNAGVAGAKPNLYISFQVTKEMGQRFGMKSRQVREPVNERTGGTKRAAEVLLAQRRRQVKEGTWRPKSSGGSADTMTLSAYAESYLAMRDAAKVKSAHDERQRLSDHVFTTLGERRIRDITRKDIVALINNYQRTPSEATKDLPAPRTVHRVYEDLRTMFAHALEVDEIIPATPCTLKVKRGELPEKLDKDPRWRATAVYTRPEVETLISDPKAFWPQRVIYGLMFLTGSRIDEVAGVRWCDYDTVPQPLGRLVIATQGSGGRTKTGTTRQIPVHPVLASVLASWRLEGFPLYFGSAPRPDDYIVPRIRERGLTPFRELPQYGSRVWGRLQADLARHGFRPRRTHDARRTLITLARADGSREDLLKWITHGPSKSKIMDVYSTPPWDVLCEQISCLRIELLKPDGATVHRLPTRGAE